MISVEDFCRILHLECLGPWHRENSSRYRPEETHSVRQHIEMAKLVFVAIEQGADKVIDIYTAK